MHERSSEVMGGNARSVLSKHLSSEDDDVHAAEGPSSVVGGRGNALALAQIRRCEWRRRWGSVA